MAEELAGQRALITGAGSGIGAAIAAAFREAGTEVTGLDIARCSNCVECDVTDEAAIAAAFVAAGQTDHVVHAAGVASIGEIASLELDEFRRVLEINLTGSFIVGREAARRLPPGGTLTFLSSQAGRRGGALWGAYCASKFGVIGLCESLAQELAPGGIRVNAVCPGMVGTEMASRLVDSLAKRRGVTSDVLWAEYVSRVPIGRAASPEDSRMSASFSPRPRPPTSPEHR